MIIARSWKRVKMSTGENQCHRLLATAGDWPQLRHVPPLHLALEQTPRVQFEAILKLDKHLRKGSSQSSQQSAQILEQFKALWKSISVYSSTSDGQYYCSNLFLRKSVTNSKTRGKSEQFSRSSSPQFLILCRICLPRSYSFQLYLAFDHIWYFFSCLLKWFHMIHLSSWSVRAPASLWASFANRSWPCRRTESATYFHLL